MFCLLLLSITFGFFLFAQFLSMFSLDLLQEFAIFALGSEKILADEVNCYETLIVCYFHRW